MLFLAGVRWSNCWVAAVVLKFLFLGPSVLHAQTTPPTDTWQGPTIIRPPIVDSSWFTGTNWGPIHLAPISTQDAIVNNGQIAQVGPVPSPSVAPAHAANLTVGATAAGSTVQVLTSANLTLSSVTVGPQGTLQFSGGFITVPGFQNNGLMLIDGTNPQTFDVPITGSGRLTLASATTLTLGLSNANDTYTGATLISAGTLIAGSTTGLSLNSAVTVNAATLDLHGFSNTIGSLTGTGIVLNNAPAIIAILTAGNDNTSTTFGGLLQNGTGVLGLTKSGTGTQTLTGNNTYTGGTTINGGTLQLGNGGTTGSVIGNVVDIGVLSFDRSNLLAFAGSISGSGSVTQIGSGITTLTGNNTYAGSTTISGGTLQAGSITGLSPTSAFTVNSILDLNGFNNTIGSLSGTGFVLNNAAATTAILTTGNDNTSTTFSGLLENGIGVLGLTKSGAGTQTLTGNNTYSGGTTINGGTLQLGNGGTTGTIAGNVANNGILAFDRSDTLIFAGAISGLGSVTQIGTGTTILTGNSTYTGGTTISVGTLQLGNGGTTGAIIGNVINNGVLSFDRSDSATFGGLISGAGSLTQIGTGTTILTGNNTYAGGTTISAGTLQLGNGGTTGAIIGDVTDNGVLSFDRSDSAMFGGLISGAGSVAQIGSGTTILTGNNTYTGGATVSAGTLQLGNGGTTGSIIGNVVDNSVLVFDRSDTVTFGGLISGAGRIAQIGTGTTILTNNNTYSGGTTISAGTLQLGNGGTTGSIVGNVLDNSVLAFNRSDTVTFGGLISGAGSVSQAGTGTTILTNNNTYTGGTTISAGTLQLGNGGATGGIVGNVIDNGVLAFNRSDPVTFGGIVSGAGALVNIGTGTLTLTGSNTYTGGTTISAGTLQIGNGGTSGSITGNVLDNSVLAFNRSDSLTFGGIISGTGSLVKLGTGTLILTGNNTYTGGATVSAGTLQLGNGGTTGSIIGNVVDNSVLVFDRSDTVTFGGLISGAGSIAQIGTGTTILTNNNTYSGGTTISAGTLQLGNGGTTGNIIGNVLDNSVLAFNRSDTVTFGGLISGAGSVSQAGSGTTILTNNNTYTGGTTIGAGTLQLGNGGTLGSIVGNVTDNSVLAFNRSDPVTFGGIVSGTGALVNIGTGTLTLTGSNTYTGGTTISAGTLQIGNGGTSGSITGNILDNSVLAFNRSDSLTFGGIVSGTGSLVNLGTGTLTLTGTNTYTGGTTISAGTLQIGNGGTTGSITGNVLDNGLLVFNRSDSVTFGGVISGTGGLIQQGMGVLTLSGANTYTGTTVVNNGSLIVDGAIGSLQTIVNAGGFLGGHGTIGGNLINNGIVGQLLSPGTLTVLGNFIQNPGGTLRIALGGLTAGLHDLLAVNGHVTLGGTLQIVNLGSFSLQPGNQLLFLTANNGVSGSFSAVLTGTIVKGVVITLPNAVLVQGQQGSFTQIPGFTLTPNEAAVGKALNSAAGDPRAAALIAFLNSQPLANLPRDLALIAPTQITSINATAVSLGNIQLSNLEQRLGDIREGSTGFSSSGFAISGPSASLGQGFAGVTGPEGKGGPSVFAPTPSNRWGVFLTGLGEFTNVDSTSNAPGYDVDTGGFTFGVDYRLTPNFAVGLTAGYAHTGVHPDGGGNIDVNGGKIGLYATAFAKGFYLDAAVSGGPSGYNTRRTALLGTASGSTDGADVNALVAAGYDWKYGNLTLGPTASFQFSYIGLDGFTETGSLAPLKFPDQNTESERTAFGGKASYDWKVGHVTVIPQVSAAWQHEYGDTEYSVAANFASGAGSSFTVRGPHIGRDSLLLGAGATVIWNDRVSTYLYYDGEVARTNYESHNVSGGVRISF
jgi:autotransporter-associated beta strand protein